MAARAFRNQFEIFLLEAIINREERGLLQALQENPDDKATKAAYVDFLLDTGRPQSAELVRNGYVPGAIVHRDPPSLVSGQFVDPFRFPPAEEVGRLSVVSGSIRSGQIHYL